MLGGGGGAPKQSATPPISCLPTDTSEETGGSGCSAPLRPLVDTRVHGSRRDAAGCGLVSLPAPPEHHQPSPPRSVWLRECVYEGV